MDTKQSRPPERLSRRLMQAREELSRLREELRELRESNSWRITSPLRTLIQWLRARNSASVPASIPRFDPDARIPDPLLCVDLPVSGSDQSCRLVDAAPFLAGLIPDDVIESFLGESASGTTVWSYSDGSRQPIAVISGPTLARELAFEVPVLRVTCTGGPVGTGETPPSLLLLDTDLHDMEARWSRELRTDSGAVRSILEEYASKGIPTVIWLRCDAEEYRHLRRWLAFADRVYAVDPAVFALAQADVPADKLGLLGPKIQPRLHNPLKTEVLSGLKDVDRLTVLQDALAEVVAGSVPSAEVPEGATVLLLDSYWDIPAAKVEAMAAGARTVLGVAGVADKIVLLKLADAELFMDSHIRPSWRIQQDMLRAAACGATVVVDTRLSRAWPLHTVLPFATSVEEFVTKATQSSLDVAIWRRCAVDEVLTLHTIRHALSRIMADLDLAAARSTALMSCLLVTRRPEKLDEALANFARQTHPYCELIVVLHGYALPQARLEAGGRRIEVMEAPSTMSLGDCLNLAASNARGEYWAKMDDDDDYAPSYLVRMQVMIEAAEADIAGMPLVFTRFESDGAVYCDPSKLALAYRVGEGWRRGEICGATLAGSMDILRRVPFRNGRRQGVDTLFLDDCSRRGARIAVGDGFGYLCRRSSDATQHTWEGDEQGVRARGMRLHPAQHAAAGLLR